MSKEEWSAHTHQHARTHAQRSHTLPTLLVRRRGGFSLSCCRVPPVERAWRSSTTKGRWEVPAEREGAQCSRPTSLAHHACW